MNKTADRFSKPIQQGMGYVIDEQRGDLAFRSHVLPTYKAAMAYRAAQIKKAEHEQEGR